MCRRTCHRITCASQHVIGDRNDTMLPVSRKLHDSLSQTTHTDNIKIIAITRSFGSLRPRRQCHIAKLFVEAVSSGGDII
jgi:hypothetical protein